MGIDQQSMILLDQTPILAAVGGGLTGDNDMPAMLGATLDGIGIRAARGQIRVFTVERDASLGGPVQRGRLLDGVVAQAERDELRAVGHAHVQTVGLHVLGAQHRLLQGDDLPVRRDQGVAHLARRVLPFPGFFPTAGGCGQICHVQRGQVLRVGGAMDVLVRGLGEQLEQWAADVGEVGDDAVVHEGVAAEDERVVVDRGDRRGARGGADVGEDGRRRRVGADGVEVGVVHGRRARLEQCWSETLAVAFKLARAATAITAGGFAAVVASDERGADGRVPCDAEAVDVEEAVAQRDFVLACFLARNVREEFREVVVVDLFGETVVRRDQDVFE